MDKNIVWQRTQIDREKREQVLNQKGLILWFTGLSGSGKSTLAVEVERNLNEKGRATYLLDGDNIRHGLNADLGFSPEERAENIRRIGEVAALFLDAGIITLASFISPYKKDRERIRKLSPKDRFVEIHVDCPLEVCEERDVKGLYKKAREGLIQDFTGISAPYENPEAPEIYLNTAETPMADCVGKIMEFLNKNDFTKTER